MAKTKTFATLGILALLILSLSIVSAANLEFTNVSSLPTTVTQGTKHTIGFTLNNTADANYTLNWSSNEDYWTNLPDLDSINISQNLRGSAEITIPSDRTGAFEPELKVKAYNTSDGKYVYTDPASFSTSIQEESEEENSTTEDTTCQLELGESETTSYLEIIDFDIDNLGEGEDDTWNPLDEIQITLEVEALRDDIDDVMVEVFVYDGDNEVTNDFDFEEETYDLGNMDEDDKEEATFTITELPVDVEEKDYELRFIVYSDEDESICVSKSDEFDEEFFHNIEVEKEYDQAVIVREGDSSTTIDANPGQRVQTSFNIYNIGDDEEDHVLVQIFNNNLGINEFKHFRNLDVGDKKTVTYDLEIPSDVEEGKYNVDITTYFDYDEGDVLEWSSYDENSFDDLDESYSFNFDVKEIPGATNPTIDASLASSETMVGEQLAVNLVITNNKAETANTVISAEGYDAWANSVEVNPQILTLDAGQTKQSTITLMPTEAGQQSFTIKIIQDGNEFVRTVAVSISEEPGIFGDLFEGAQDTILYVAAGILALLIILVIVLIVKVSRRPKSTEF